MVSKTSICNLGLSHLAVGREINNLETETTAEAQAMRRVYDTCLQVVLRDFDWPFATKFAALALIEEDPTSEWAYSYQYPADCLNFRRILSGIRNESNDTSVPYRLAYGDDGQIILTDKDEAECEYTILVEDPSKYPPDFVMAFSFLLAGTAGVRITAGDPNKLSDRAMQMYSYLIKKAQGNSRNEERKEPSPDAEMIRVRG